eukprot:642550-Rhodomonas_salina.1
MLRPWTLQAEPWGGVLRQPSWRQTGRVQPLHQSARCLRQVCTPTPYTLHLRPYTLHPAPYTLHPTPYTLDPTPQTLALDPRLSTLDTRPLTLDPRPQTLTNRVEP